MRAAVMGLSADLAFRTKGQLATGMLAEAFADGVRLDFVCGDFSDRPCECPPRPASLLLAA